MPRKKDNEAINEAIRIVKEAIKNGNVEVVSNISGLGSIPKREEVRKKLEEYFGIGKDKVTQPKVFLVEDLGTYKVYIKIPGYKSTHDFFVVSVEFDKNNEIKNIKVPTHDDLAKLYLQLKQKHEALNEYLINATIRYIRDRWSLCDILNKYFKDILDNEEIMFNLKKFFLTLKWMVIQEDANYPPDDKNLGSLYTLALYALLELYGNMSLVRKVLRW